MARPGVGTYVRYQLGRVKASASISQMFININCVEYSTLMVDNTLSIYCLQGTRISCWVFGVDLAEYNLIERGKEKHVVYVIDNKDHSIDTPAFKFTYDGGVVAYIASHFDIFIQITSEIKVRVERGAYRATKMLPNTSIVFDNSYADAFRSLSEVLKLRKLLLDAGL